VVGFERLESTGSSSLSDVARLAGVSLATASRALGNSRPVTPELRARVLEAAAKLDYAANPHARALARSRDGSVGVVVHDLSDPYFSEIVRGALEGAEATDRMLLICNTYRDPERDLAYIRHFRAQRVEALLLVGSGRLDRRAGARVSSEIIGFEGAGGRAVLIGRHQATGDTVQPENREGASLMACHLSGLGHRRIAVVAGPPELTTSHDRLEGFRQGLERAGVELPEDHVRSGGFTRAGAERAAGELLDALPDLTAIFALTDVMAIGVLGCLRRRRLRVPEDLSVAGFDDIPVAADVTPALTTVQVPMVELGRRAFALAFAPRSSGYRTERLPTALVARESTSAPRRRLRHSNAPRRRTT
jgi:LacI family transcriptional regulator